MTLLLLKVSGVGLLEKTLAKTKPGYKEYMETTSAFIPWFSQKGAR
jgi:steroid 5-alpha reductase family enzyme